ncbi:MAG TPA: type I methionyl aminopeptidase [Clostridia bacterium]|nr:type I methionyl aminopeptidase [Clostridia bacterium]
MIILKSRRELKIMKKAGLVAANTTRILREAIAPGVRTRDLDIIAEDYMRKSGAYPAFKGYRGFPASICTSINDQVVHGIPGDRILKEGDIISIDLGTILDGFYSDTAFTVGVGEISEEAKRLLAVTEESLWVGIRQARPGRRLGDISSAIQGYVEAHGFSVVRDFVGHGIGRQMHEEPQVPNFGVAGSGPVLKPGMTLAIEPMVNAGGYEVIVAPDNWTVFTSDGSLSAHFEHTVAITVDGPVVLTSIDEEVPRGIAVFDDYAKDKVAVKRADGSDEDSDFDDVEVRGHGPGVAYEARRGWRNKARSQTRGEIP